MTVTSENCVVGYAGNGSNKDFAFNFLIQNSGSLKLHVNGALQSTNYSVTGLNNPAGGSVHYPVTGAAITSSDYLEIFRDTPYTQESDFTSQGPFDPTSLEEALDQLALQIQQLAAASLPRYTTVALPSPSRKGQLVYDITRNVPVYSNGVTWLVLGT